MNYPKIVLSTMIFLIITIPGISSDWKGNIQSRGEKISWSEFENWFKIRLPRYQLTDSFLNESELKQLVNQFVLEKYVHQFAPVESLETTLYFKKYFNYQRDFLLINALYEREIQPKVNKDFQRYNQMLKSYYRKNIKDFMTPETYRLRFITCKFDRMNQQTRLEAFQKAKQAVEKLQAGEDFETIAKKYSDAPEDIRGIIVGPFKSEKLNHATLVQLKRLKDGEFSNIFSVKTSYLIIQREEYTPKSIDSFESVKTEIRDKVPRYKSFNYYLFLYDSGLLSRYRISSNLPVDESTIVHSTTVIGWVKNEEFTLKDYHDYLELHPHYINIYFNNILPYHQGTKVRIHEMERLKETVQSMLLDRAKVIEALRLKLDRKSNIIKLIDIWKRKILFDAYKINSPANELDEIIKKYDIQLIIKR